MSTIGTTNLKVSSLSTLLPVSHLVTTQKKHKIIKANSLESFCKKPNTKTSTMDMSITLRSTYDV